MIHQVVSEIWVFRMGSTILEHLVQYSSNSDPLFDKNKILKLEDLAKLKTLKLMYNFDRCKLPNSFTEYLKKISQIHSRVTRLSDNNILHLPRC